MCACLLFFFLCLVSNKRKINLNCVFRQIHIGTLTTDPFKIGWTFPFYPINNIKSIWEIQLNIQCDYDSIPKTTRFNEECRKANTEYGIRNVKSEKRCVFEKNRFVGNFHAISSVHVVLIFCIPFTESILCFYFIVLSTSRSSIRFVSFRYLVLLSNALTTCRRVRYKCHL